MSGSSGFLLCLKENDEGSAGEFDTDKTKNEVNPRGVYFFAEHIDQLHAINIAKTKAKIVDGIAICE